MTCVSIREIAGRAGVQHTLIRRHFGSRDALLALVVAETLSQFAEAVDAAPDLPAAVRTGLDQVSSNRALTSGMAVLVLGQGLNALERYPLADAYEAQLVRAGMDPGHARDAAVMVIAVMSGWALGAEFWLNMAGRSHDPRGGRELIEPAVWAVIDHAMPPPTTRQGDRTHENATRTRSGPRGDDGGDRGGVHGLGLVE